MRTVVVAALGLCLAACGAESASGGKDAAGTDTTGNQDLILDSTPGADSTQGADSAGDATAPTDDAEVIYRTCSFVAACLDDSRIGLYAGTCFADLLNYLTMSADPTKEYERLIDCAATSTTCAEFVACDRMNATYDCKSPSDSACVGDAFVQCLSSSQIRRIFDCKSAEGMSCVAGKGCTSATACPIGEGFSKCDGNTIVECGPASEEQGVNELRYDCPQGAACQEIQPYPSVPAVAFCYRNMTPEDSCSTAYSCEGETLKGCGNGLAYSLDCAAWGQTCVTTPFPSCAPAATECVVRQGQGQPAGTYQDNCDGNTMKTCMNGRIIEIDCAVLGKDGTCQLVGTLAGDQRAICQ